MNHSCARTQLSRPRRETGPAPTAVATALPSSAEVARLAYAYWEARGHRHGSAQEDWYRAERELLIRRCPAGTSYLV